MKVGIALAVAIVFTVVGTAIWWAWGGWEPAEEHLLSTIILTPIVWYLFSYRYDISRVRVGIGAGAVSGFATQMAPHVFDACQMWFRSKSTGEEEAIAILAFVIFSTFALIGTVVGSIVGAGISVALRKMGVRRYAS